jgi:hypothetical protein
MSESCSIQNIGQIKINGLSDKIKIVGLDYQVGDLKQSSRISVTLIDKDSVLDIVPLSLQSPMEIFVGSIKFVGFPITEERGCSPSGDNTIKIDFVDGSFILDKILVGLWGKHHQSTIKKIKIGGRDFKSWKRGNFYGSDPFIIVGDFIDPCGDDELDFKVDPCDPCKDSPIELVKELERDMRRIDCEKLRDSRILEVEYSFPDLVTAINNGWPPLRIEQASTLQGVSNYKADYSGTLREVLNNWCRDFGWSYYWENGIIKIFPINAGISINTKGLENDCNVLNINKTRSLEGTYSNNILGYFGREGQERNYQCQYQFGKRVVCRALNLKDLLSPLEPKAKVATAYTGTSGSWEVSHYDLLELLCMCGMYSPRLREAIAFLNVYGIVHAESAQERVETSKSITGINGVSIGYKSYHDMDYADDLVLGKDSLPLLDLTIKKVFSKGVNPEGFEKLARALGGEVEALYDNLGNEDAEDFYLFIGSRSEERFSTRYEWEAAIGSDFLGKYFIRKYDTIHGNSPSVTPAGGDSAKYYEQAEIGLDFTKFFTTSNPESYVSELVNEEGAASTAFILVERSPIWIPPSQEGDDLGRLIEICDNLVPTEITNILSVSLGGDGDLSSEELKNDHPQLSSKYKERSKANGGWTDKDLVFLVKKYKDSQNSGALSISNLQTYDWHPKDKTKEVEIEGYQTPVKIGLRSTQSKKVQIENIVFWFPPQSTVREQEEGPETEHIPYAGGYYVFLNNNASVDTNLLLPKIETIQVHSYPHSSNTMRSNMIPASLSESDIEEYFYDEVKLGCDPDLVKIEESINEYITPLKVNQTQESIETQIEINGIPNLNFEIEDGFRSISVRLYGDAPVSTIVFRNSIPIPPDLKVNLEMKKNGPLFGNEQKERRWNKPNEDYPNEGGYPTI